MGLQSFKSKNINLCNDISSEIIDILNNTKDLIKELKSTNNFYKIKYELNTSLNSRGKSPSEDDNYGLTLELSLSNLKGERLDYTIIDIPSISLGDYGYLNCISMIILSRLAVSGDYSFVSSDYLKSYNKELHHKRHIKDSSQPSMISMKYIFNIHTHLMSREGNINTYLDINNEEEYYNFLRSSIIEYSYKIYFKDLNSTLNKDFSDTVKLSDTLFNLKKIDFNDIKSDIYYYFSKDDNIKKVLEKDND